MCKKVLLVGVALALFCSLAQAIAEEQDLPKEKVIDIATAAVKEKGMDLTEVDVVYDDGNKLWAEEIGAMTMPDDSPNYGVLKRGFLKNYQTVFFDFKEPIKDIWVFIDSDTGEVFEVYQEQ